MAKSAELERGAELAASVWQKLVGRIRHNNGLLEDLNILAQPEGDLLIDTFTRQLAAAGAKQRNEYVVPVDYDLAHPHQVEAAKFDWTTDYDRNLIRTNCVQHLFPIPSGRGEPHITLLHTSRCATTLEMLAEMDRLSLRPALSVETLAFAKAHPDVQRQFPLLGLGSVWVDSSGDRTVLCLYERNVDRLLGLTWCDGVWNSGFRFLAVRK